MILPDDKEPMLQWDETKKKWVNSNGEEEEEKPLEPPPAVPLGSLDPSQNQFMGRIRSDRSRYRDVLSPQPNGSSPNQDSSGTVSPPPLGPPDPAPQIPHPTPVAPQSQPQQPQFFIPTPGDSAAEFTGFTTAPDPPAGSDGAQQEMQFFNPANIAPPQHKQSRFGRR